MERFVNWLTDNGVNMSDIEIINIKNNERSVRTKKNLIKGDTFFLIPKKLLIMSENVNKTIIGKKIINLFSDSTQLTQNIVSMSAFILLSNADYYETNFWKPYFDILPKNLNHIPSFWSKDLYYLKGSPILHEIRNRVKSIRSEYNKLVKNGIPLKENNISFNDYKRVRALVSSRNFNLHIEGVQNTTLVPLADMLNHSMNADTSWGYNDQRGGYVMTMRKNVKKYNEVSDSYGRKTNDKYLLYYGFLLKEASVEIKVKLKNYSINLSGGINSIETKNLLNHLRRKKLEREQTYSYGFVDVYNEKKVMMEFRKILNKMKRKYPRSLSFYKKNKKTGSLNKKNAYNLVSMELEIIEDYLKKIKCILNFLRGKNVKNSYEDVNIYMKALASHGI
jgi:hypothetical protein